MAAWLTESQVETEHKRLGLEGTVNQRKTQDEERQGKLKQALEQLTEVKTQGEDKQEKLEQALAQLKEVKIQSEERQEKLKHALAQVAEINNDVDKKTTKGIYPALEVKGATGGADIHQFPMIQMAGGAAGGGWVWRSWTPQDIRGVKASMEECLKTNPRRAIQILHDQIKMQGATRTDIGFICTAVLPSSIWSSHAADWGVKVEDEADNTLNQHLPAGNEREAQAVYRGRVQALMDELATAMAPRVMDWQAIQEVTQDEKESPAEYKTRLYEQIELHSGYDNPAEIPRHFLNTMFVDGLCDEVRKEVKADMPGW